MPKLAVGRRGSRGGKFEKRRRGRVGTAGGRERGVEGGGRPLLLPLDADLRQEMLLLMVVVELG